MTQELNIAERAVFQECSDLKEIILDNHGSDYATKLDESLINGIPDDNTDWVKELQKTIEVYQGEVIEIIKGIGEKIEKKREKELFKNTVYCTFDNKEKSTSLMRLYDAL